MDKEITIRYLDGSTDRVTIPELEGFDVKITGNKEIAKSNFRAIMKNFLRWLNSRDEWIKKYQSIRQSLERNPDRDYLLGLMRNYDNPNSWLHNTTQQDISISVVYSFEIVQALGERFFCTGPYLFIRGYTFCASKKLFEIQIKCEHVDV